MELVYRVIKSTKYKTLRNVLKNEFNISSRLLIKLKKANKIFLNDNLTYLDKELSNKDIVKVILDFEEDNSNIVPLKMNLDIIYEDEYYLVINKPSGIAIHPSISHFDDTLSNGIRYHFDKIGLKKKIRPVNRLDFDTSGLVVFAKNEYINECLSKKIQEGKFYKEYLTIVNGILENKKRNYKCTNYKKRK